MSEEQFKKSSSNELPQTEPDICETHTSNRPSRVESCSPTGSVPMKKPRSDRLSSPVVPPSPPKTVSLDQLAQAAKDFYRMSLAHEITMDADFKLESSTKPEEGLRQKVKETMHAAFWDLQRQKLEADPPDYSSALELLKEIKSSLVDMILPYQSSLRAQINDKLDIATAEAQLAETGRFDLASYTTPIIDIMATWCAPARDADVARLHDITDSVDFLKRVFEILEQMHMDLANFTIEKMRPYIRQHAAVYEREKFDQCLEAQKKAGVDGLARTRQWLQEAFKKLCESAKNSPALSSPCRPSAPSSSAPVGVGGPATSAVSHPASPPPPTPNNILREAYLALLTWDSENEFPETMLVDASRIQDLSDCLTRTVTLASVILTVCNTVAHNYIVCLSPGQTSLPAGSMTRLKETVSNDVRGLFDSTSASKLPNLIDLVTARVLAIVGHWRHRLCTAASTSLEDADHQWAALPHCDLPEELQDQLVKQVTAVLNGEHPVYNLMFSRALDFLRSALSARPPDPLTLPSGFGALSESGGPTGVPKAVPSCDRLIAGGALQKTPLSATGAPEGDAHTDLGRTYDLTIIASRLMPLVAHNRHVFGPHYAEIIQGLLLQGQNGGDAVVAPT
ncbi:T-complex protein 11 [Sparganum proliferum]